MAQFKLSHYPKSFLVAHFDAFGVGAELASARAEGAGWPTGGRGLGGKLLPLHPTAKMATGGNLTTDAHLAALAIEHGAELYSRDGDFARFPGVRWRDPLS